MTTHVVVVPFPAQGHVTPLLKFAQRLADYGIKATFVVTKFLHKKIVSADPEIVARHKNLLCLVPIDDGLESKDQNDPVKQDDAFFNVFPLQLQNLIERINSSDADEKISYVMADFSAWWALELAKKMGIKRVACFLQGLGVLAFNIQIPKFIESGLIDADGMPMTDSICLSEEFPAWTSDEFPWSWPYSLELQKLAFHKYYAPSNQAVEISETVLVNTFYDLEPSAHELVPKILSIGPLLTTTHSGHFSGNFWQEDPTSLNWLDKQLKSSVIYVSFGSVAELGKQQFQELALGLELTNQPFLWVVRIDIANGSKPEFPDGFVDRISDRGKIVDWCCQEKVLAHPATACFLSHCGWNSTMEGISMGVPFLCWPYAVDQFRNATSISKVWNVGVQLKADDHGVVTRHEIVTKVKTLLSDDGIKGNAVKLKEMARKSVGEDGSSFKNFQSLVEQLKSQDS